MTRFKLPDNVSTREVERELVPLIEKEGLRELPYWSLAKGFLTGKYRPGKSVDSARAGAAGRGSTPRTGHG